jgi:cytochrome c553
MEECMNKTVIAGLLGAGLLGAAGAALASDTHTRVISSTCLSCHGPDGKSKSAMPSLAGMDKTYFVTQMKAFKSGARPASVMHRHAPGYTDQEFEKMGEYFAAMK